MKVYKDRKRPASVNKVFAFLRRHILVIVVALIFVVGVIATIMIVNREDHRTDGENGAISILQPATEVRLAMYNPKSFDPLASSDEDVVYINQLVYAYLFRLDSGLNIAPDMVESYIPNREAGSVELVLKEGITFSDGTAMNAYDVEYTINTIIELGKESPYFTYASKIAKVFVTGRNSLFIEFASPNDAALDNLVFPIVSAEAYNKSKFNVGGGPYKYGEYVAEKSLSLEPNELYYGSVPSMPVYIGLVKDKAILPGLTTMDDVTAYLSKEASADDIALDKMLRCRYIPSGELEYLGFNCNDNILSNSTMRRAIAYAIDRNEIINADYGKGAVISDSLYYPGFLGVEEGDSITYDPKKAAELLGTLGYADMNEDKLLEDENGQPITLKLLVRNDSGNRKDAAMSIVKNLNAVGISVEVITLYPGELTAYLRAGNFDMYLGGIKMDKQFKMAELFGSENYGKFDNETVLALIGQLEQCLSREEQKGVFTALKPLLNSELPYFCLGYKTYYFVSVSTLALTENPTFFDPYRYIGNWVWQKKITAEE